MVDAATLDAEIRALVRHDDGLTAETIDDCPQVLEVLGETGQKAVERLEQLIEGMGQSARVEAIKTALGIGADIDMRGKIRERRVTVALRLALQTTNKDREEGLARQVRDNYEKKGRALVVGKLIKLYELQRKNGKLVPMEEVKKDDHSSEEARRQDAISRLKEQNERARARIQRLSSPPKGVVTTQDVIDEIRKTTQLVRQTTQDIEAASKKKRGE